MRLFTSKSIRGVEYNSQTKDLAVHFNNGRIYVHHGVPKEVYEQFVNAPSKGQYYNLYIRGKYL